MEKSAEVETTALDPNLVQRIEGGAKDPDYWVNRLMPDDGPEDGDLEADDRALRMMEIENERADHDLQRMELENQQARIDLDRERLAHDQVVAADHLRMAALDAAQTLLVGSHPMPPAAKADFLEAQYRRILALLEDLDPAADAEDGQAG